MKTNDADVASYLTKLPSGGKTNPPFTINTHLLRLIIVQQASVEIGEKLDDWKDATSGHHIISTRDPSLRAQLSFHHNAPWLAVDHCLINVVRTFSVIELGGFAYGPSRYSKV